jgi:hypothetical protein
VRYDEINFSFFDKNDYYFFYIQPYQICMVHKCLDVEREEERVAHEIYVFKCWHQGEKLCVCPEHIFAHCVNPEAN